MNEIIRDDEIDLRELFLVLWRRRALLILILFAALAVSLAVTFIPPREYTASAIISVSREDILTHSEMLKSTIIRNRLRPLAGNEMLEALSLTPLPQEKVPFIELRVRGADPLRVDKISDLWAVTYLDYLAEGRIKALEKSILSTQNNIISLKEEIKEQPEFITHRRAMGDESILMKMSENKDIWDTLKYNILITETPNPIVSDLRSDISSQRLRLKNLEESIERAELLRADLRALSARELAEMRVSAGGVQFESYAGLPRLVSRGLVKNIVLATALALFLGILLSFLAEFVSGALIDRVEKR